MHDRAELVRQFAGQDAVINLVGILNEGGGESFRRAHYELPLSVLAACQSAGVPRLLHQGQPHESLHATQVDAALLAEVLVLETDVAHAARPPC